LHSTQTHFTLPWLHKLTHMGHILLVLFALLVLVQTSVAQGPASVCYFGTVGLDFRTEPPTVLNNSGMDGLESPASICDVNGDLLFYTNGGKSPTAPSVGGIWNRQHQMMDNGLMVDSGGCLSSYSGAVIVPFPNVHGRTSEARNYYVFARGCMESTFSTLQYNSGLTYSVVDMDADNGLGAVVEKYVTVMPYSVIQTHMTNHEPVAAILHGNGTDYWLFSYTDNALYELKLTSDGISDFRSFGTAEGRITVSPARNFLLAGNDLYAFDANTGDLVHHANGPFSRGAFSPDGRLLYARDGASLYQYPLLATDPMAERIWIGAFAEDHDLFLAPDGRIYVRGLVIDYLPGLIRCPNRVDTACDLSYTALSLNGGTSGMEFTNVMAHYLYRQGDVCDPNSVGMPLDASRFILSPDATTGKVNITSEMLGSFSVQAFSMDGRLIHQSQHPSGNAMVDLSSLSGGVYIFKVLAGERLLTKRVLLTE
jgi:hypothetical protein